MILQRISGSCEGEDAEGMEDGLGAAHREENPLGCDGSARDSARVSVNRDLPVLAEAIGVSLW